MKRFSLVIAFAVLMSPLATSAVTSEELQAQIATLLAQISQVQGQLQLPSVSSVSTSVLPVVSPVTAVPTPPSSLSLQGAQCYSFQRTMSRGSRGDDVRLFQQYLVSLNLLPADAATGFFGALTQGAVQSWQSSNGIVNSGTPATTGWGMFGARTRAAMLAACVRPAVTQSCPEYQMPICSTNQHIVQSLDPQGCKAAPQCMTGATSCPIYNACPTSASTSLSTDARGCTIISCTQTSVTCGVGSHSQNNQCVPDAPTTILCPQGSHASNNQCVPDVTTSCPQYMPPLCNSNQHLVSGAYNSSTGCSGAPQCVSN